jgi:MFS family permease
MDTPGHPTTTLKKTLVFLGLQKSMFGLLSMVILVGMGEKMADRFLPMYLIALGGGALSIGLLNGFQNLLSALYSFPGGYLADRIGFKRSLLIFNLIAMSGFILVIVVPSWYAVIAGSVLFMSWTAISLPATMKLISQVLPTEKRTMGVSIHSLVRRIPMALGPLAGGALIGMMGIRAGIRIGFLTALVLAVIAAFLQQILILDDTRKEAKNTLSKNPFRLFSEMSRDLRRLLVSDILIRFCEQIPSAFVVVWCMKIITHPVSAFQFGILTSVEMAMAVLVYIPVAYLADRSTKKPFIVITFIFFTLFPLVLLFSHHFSVLILAFILRGLKEFGEPTRKALILDLAPEGKKAGMFGVYYLIRDTIVSIAAFGGAFLWTLGPSINFLVAFFFGCAGTIWFAIYGTDMKQKEPSSRATQAS